jgi:hypothetical protein
MSDPKFMYRASSSFSFVIERVEIVEETLAMVKVKGEYSRQKKMSDHHVFTPDFNQAKQFLLNIAEKSVQQKRRNLELANAALGNVKGMKEPA